MKRKIVMKRFFLYAVAALMLICAAGCGAGAGDGGNEPFKGMTLNEVLDAVYEGTSVDTSALMTTEITKENEQYFLGATGLDYKEAIASEPAISAIAYSVCLVRMNEGADIEAARKAIEQGIDPAKWICVTVDRENIITDSTGDIIILIMSDAQAGEIHDSFVALKA